jgi:hypothetical protein
MMGLGSLLSDPTYSDTRTLLNIADMISDPDRKRLTEQLRELHAALKKIDAARRSLSEVEAELLRREQKVVADEAANAKRSADLDEREVRAQALLHRAEQGIAELAALKADLKSKMAA